MFYWVHQPLAGRIETSFQMQNPDICSGQRDLDVPHREHAIYIWLWLIRFRFWQHVHQWFAQRPRSWSSDALETYRCYTWWTLRFICQQEHMVNGQAAIATYAKSTTVSLRHRQNLRVRVGARLDIRSLLGQGPYSSNYGAGCAHVTYWFDVCLMSDDA